MMVAVGLTVLMMTMVVTIFGLVMDGIRDSRGAIEVTDRLRAAKNRLQLDLMELTAPLTPPLDPALGLGYFEYIEGPIGPVVAHPNAGGTDTPGLQFDNTVGDIDDILMFTVTSNDEPFVGRAPAFVDVNQGVGPVKMRWQAITVQSYTAEIVWFMRGNVLHRRTLLVYPNLQTPLPTFSDFNTYVGSLDADEYHPKSIYEFCDISVHLEGDPTTPGNLQPVPNTLNDLTNRENRYGHQPFAWPHDARLWSGMSLPTTEEYSSGVLNNDQMTPATSPINTKAVDNSRKLFYPKNQYDGNPFTTIGTNDAINPCPRLFLPGMESFDAWLRPHPSTAQNQVTGQITDLGTRVGEDVILTNVIGFDVKVWDPGAPIITLNDTTTTTYPNPPYPDGAQVPNGEAILPTDSKFYIPPSADPAPTANENENIAIAAALDRLNEANGGADLDQIVGYGTYVDLNYMCRFGPGSYSGTSFDPNTPLNTIETASGHVRFPNFLNDQNTTLRDTNPPAPQFHHHGDMRSGLFGTFPIARFEGLSLAQLNELLRPSVYDTFSTSYENDSINQADVPWNPARINNSAVLPTKSGTNGLDDNGNGAVDESSAWPNIYDATNPGFAGEKETAPPYPNPLRGIQVKIRVFEPATRQIREVTVEHEVLTQ